MQPSHQTVLSELKCIEENLNQKTDYQKKLIDDPVQFFHSLGIPISDRNAEFLGRLTSFFTTKVPIADPVTMIYE